MKDKIFDKKTNYVFIISILLLILVGFSYAYYSATVIGNDKSSNDTVKAGTLELTFDGTSILNIDKFSPGDKVSMTFSVENTGDREINTYNINFINLINTFQKDEIMFSLKCTSNKGTCLTDESEKVLKTGPYQLLSTESLLKGERKLYTLTLHFISTGGDQSYNEYRSLGFKINIDQEKQLLLVKNVVDSESGYEAISGKSTPIFADNATTDEGMFVTRDQDGKTYYYRGSVTDNYVKFAGLIWRIVRINGDGSIRLILDDYARDVNGNEITSAYNSTCSNVNTISSALECAKLSNATLQSSLNEWYKNNLSNVERYLVKGKFCNDYSYQNNNGEIKFYGKYRLDSERVPNLTCKMLNTFAEGEIETTTSYIGLLTADEAALAGAIWKIANTDFYLYKSGFANWTPTVDSWNSSKLNMITYENEGIYTSSANTTGYIRPVINLKGGTQVEGSGTSTDPYVPIDSKKTYMITYVNEVTDETLFTRMVAENSTAPQITGVTQNGFEFTGWYLNGTLYDFSTPITENITLKAKYNELSPSIDYLRVNNATTSETTTYDQEVTLYLKGQNTSKVCITESATTDNCTWEDYAEVKKYSLSSGYGTKTVRGNFKNKRKISTSTVSVEYKKGNPLPQYLGVNNATTSASTVTSQTITLYAKSTDTQYMCFTEESNSNNCNWLPYSEAGQSFTLSSGYGTKTINGYFKTGQVISSINVKVNYVVSLVDAAIAAEGGYTAITRKGMESSFTSGETADSGIWRLGDGGGYYTFYYRGNVPDNYVSFAGYTWRIIRINGDGTIRMILNDYAKNTSGSNYSVAYNSASDCKDAGLLTSTTIASYCGQYGTGDYASTSISKYVNEWYNNNITGTNTNFVATGKFCSDYSMNSNSTSSSNMSNSEYNDNWLNTLPNYDNYSKKNIIKLGLPESSGGGIYYLFGARDRMRNQSSKDFEPQFVCYRTTGFSVGDAVTLNLNVGLITADEVVFAGAYSIYSSEIFKTLENNYLYKSNSAEWTMSPDYTDTGYVYAFTFGTAAANSGSLSYSSKAVTSNAYFRPVINLKANTGVSGSGTSADPYVVLGLY